MLMSQNKMADLDILAAAAAIIVIKRRRRRRELRANRTTWCRQWLADKHTERGMQHFVLREMMPFDATGFHGFLRMTPAMFDELLQMIEPRLRRSDSFMRDSITAQEMLVVTLRFLASGLSYRGLHVYHRLSVSAISALIPDVCDAIYDSLQPLFLAVPSSVDDWLKIANNFQDRWQLPHCCGALDGKHISIVKPGNSGSMFFNYKKFFSIVLMALVDADCNFIYIDVGAQGRESDGAVFNNTLLAEALQKNMLHFPQPTSLHPASSVLVPYFVVGDDAFPMRPYLMKPYSRRNLTADEQITNYRLSRGRRTSENAFGILANVFRVFHTPMHLQPDKASKIVRTACVLHNFMRQTAPKTSRLINQEDNVSFELTPLSADTHSHNYSQEAKAVREELKNYFCTVGAVAWQEAQSTAF